LRYFISLCNDLIAQLTLLDTEKELYNHHNVILFKSHSRIMLTSHSRQIRQPYSWAELEISKNAVQAIFTHLDISPGFWAVLKLFGSKENAERESLGGFNEEVWSDNDASFGK